MSEELDHLDTAQQAPEKHKKHRKRLPKSAKIAIWSIVGALLLVFVLNIVILPLTGDCTRTGGRKVFDAAADNQYIQGRTMLSAHRAGGDLAPEETMAAFKLCMEATDYRVDIVEFDVHLTKDEHLVLMHDHEVDRTSNGSEVFGKKGVTVEEKTLEELKQLNFGYNFTSPDGEYIYREEGADLTDVRILTLDEILSYLGEMRPDDLYYIIEIKDDGSIGKKAMDKLYEAMVQHDIVDRTIVGTFHNDITKYIDRQYKGKKGTVKRSASILEVLNFYYAFLWGVKQNPDKLGYDVLQIPMGLDHFFDFATAPFVDYAHSLGIAVQYWTINDPADVKELLSHGADAVMSDDPSMAYNILSAA